MKRSMTIILRAAPSRKRLPFQPAASGRILAKPAAAIASSGFRSRTQQTRFPPRSATEWPPGSTAKEDVMETTKSYRGSISMRRKQLSMKLPKSSARRHRAVFPNRWRYADDFDALMEFMAAELYARPVISPTAGQTVTSWPPPPSLSQDRSHVVRWIRYPDKTSGLPVGSSENRSAFRIAGRSLA